MLKWPNILEALLLQVEDYLKKLDSMQAYCSISSLLVLSLTSNRKASHFNRSHWCNLPFVLCSPSHDLSGTLAARLLRIGAVHQAKVA